jgi:hypothetical protein
MNPLVTFGLVVGVGSLALVTLVPDTSEAQADAAPQWSEAPFTEAPFTEASRTEASRTEASRTETDRTQTDRTQTDRTQAPTLTRSAPAYTKSVPSSESAAHGASAKRAGLEDALRGAKAATSPLTIESSLEPQGSKWVARWTVRNVSNAPVYVVAHVPTIKSGRRAPAQGRVYLRAVDGTLHLTKRMWQIPRGVRPLVRELPYLQRLEPGEAIKGGLRLPAAVASSYPYKTHRPRRTLVSKVEISFGYFTGSANPRPSPDDTGLFQVPYSELSAQRFVRSQPHAARLSVR